MNTAMTEQDLLAPTLFILATEKAPLGTGELAAKLSALLKPAGDNLGMVDGGKETRFLRTVRNIRSHATLEKRGLVMHVGPRRGEFELTSTGRAVANRVQRMVKERAARQTPASMAKVLKGMLLV
jgi:restriction endonuclease Mrr